jgi:hypothetical protein
MVSLKYENYSKEQLKFLDKQREPKSKDMGLVEACYHSPVVFAERMLGMKLYYWEIEFLYKLHCVLSGEKINKLFDGSDTVKSMVLALTSRQIGKSTTLAIFGLHASFFNKRPDKRFKSTLVVLVSRGDRQSKKLLNEIKKTYRDGDRFMRETYTDEDGKPVFDTVDSTGKRVGFFTSRLSKEDSNNAFTISWRPWDEHKDCEFILKGSRAPSSIGCYPPTDTVLGETFTIGVIDEAGHPKITEDWWFDGMKKTGDANQALWIFTSTPWQPSGFFYEYCDVDGNNGTDYVEKIVATVDTLKHDVDSGKHYDKYLDKDTAKEHYEYVLSEIKKDEALGKIDSVRRGYYCEFVRGETSYFNPDNVTKCFKDEHVQVESYSGTCDLGVDFGAQKVSQTTLTISTFIDDKVIRLWHRVYHRGTDLKLVDDIAELMTRFNIQRIIPDDCPAGSFMIEEMIQRGWNVTPMSFATWKVKKYGAFRRLLDTGKVESYKDDDLKKEMFAMEYSQGKTQSYIEHAPGYSDDLIDGFVMSSFHYLQTEYGGNTYDIDDYDEGDGYW